MRKSRKFDVFSPKFPSYHSSVLSNLLFFIEADSVIALCEKYDPYRAAKFDSIPAELFAAQKLAYTLIRKYWPFLNEIKSQIESKERCYYPWVIGFKNSLWRFSHIHKLSLTLKEDQTLVHTSRISTCLQQISFYFKLVSVNLDRCRLLLTCLNFHARLSVKHYLIGYPVPGGGIPA